MAASPVLSLLTPWLQSQRWRFNSAIALVALSTLLLVVQYYALALLFAALLAAEADSSASLSASLWPVLAVIAVCLLLRPVLQFGREWLCQSASLTIRQSIRQQLLSHLAALGPERRQFGSDGELSSQVIEQTEALDGYLSRYHVQRYLVVLTPLILITAVAFHSVLAALVLLLTAPLVPLFMILVGHAATRKNQQQFTALARMSARFLDLTRGLLTLKRLAAVDQAQAQVAYAAEAYQAGSLSVLRLAFLSGAILEFFASISIAILALYLGLGLLGLLPWAIADVPVPYQGALFILLLAPEFYAPLRQLGTDYHAKAEAEGALQALQPLLSSTPTPTTTWHPTFTQAPAISLRAVRLQGDDERVRLATLTTDIHACERVLIRGPSGCGKTSLLLSLCGFLPFDGEIRVNGLTQSRQQLANLRASIGYLSQHSAILPGSVAFNLRLARSEASDDELIDTLEQVGLWSLLQRLQGLNTVLGERGVGLSGGQLQRIALAQVLLSRATLWLLDEPCAHLDEDSQGVIYELLGKLSHGKTVLLVSHDVVGLYWLDRTLILPSPEAADVA
ncbi:MAG: thiol reductant ABC exporter subunit CydD [Bacterioplanes sp.]|nr:thiol reductant ABC exporter subunit CydD [Bacterioplanes sp.]